MGFNSGFKGLSSRRRSGDIARQLLHASAASPSERSNSPFQSSPPSR